MSSSLCITSNSPCRICLDDGATFAIFDSNENEDSIYNKLTKCVKEKVEDVKGFPRFICEKCNRTLETVCNFIDTYVESAKILETGLLKNVKQETVIPLEDFSDFEYSDAELEIKPEPKICHDKNFNDTDFESKLVEPLVLKIKRETCKPKELVAKKSGKSGPKNRTNRIGSSMLEGEFKWDGEKWSLNSNKILLNKTHKTSIKHERKPEKEKKVKLPKPKSDTTKLCDICGEVFKNPTKLSNHRRYKHKQLTVQCAKCPRKYASEYDLTKHLKRKHDGSKDFICSVCGAQFVFKGELNTHHKRVHEKNLVCKKTFKCQFCEKIYKCQKSVTIHERSVHTGHRPAVCTICNSTFFHEEYLREHMRLHTGERPFKCPICGRGYAQSGNMKSHLRNHRVADIEPDMLSKIRPSYLKYLKDYR